MKKKLRQTILFFGDLTLAYVSLPITVYLGFWGAYSNAVLQQHLLPFSFLYCVWLILFYIVGLYDLTSLRGELLGKTARALLACLLVGLTFFYLIPMFGITPKTNLAINIALFGLFVFVWRTAFYSLFSSLKQNVAFLGKGPQQKDLIEAIKKQPQLGWRFAGFLNINQPIKPLLKKYNIKMAVIAENLSQNQRLTKELYECLPLKIPFIGLALAYEIILNKVPIDFVKQDWFLENLAKSDRTVYDKLKRMADIVLAILLLTITSPFWGIIALAIKLEDNGSVFYRQERVGKDNKVFKIWKFRSMVELAEKQGAQWAKEKDERRTAVGRVIRRLHFDEFPQMLNVLKGDLSLTGPRPERPEFVKHLEKEIPHYQLRNLIKPGFTGWAQTRWIKYARTNEDAKEKFQYDLYYIKNRSFLLDLGILLRTFQLFFIKG